MAQEKVIPSVAAIKTEIQAIISHLCDIEPMVYISGYQPAQKWLKDRAGQKLSFNDILHYQKIIKARNKSLNAGN
jgi:hypothetical protein